MLRNLSTRITWTVRFNAFASVALGLGILLWPHQSLVVAAVTLAIWLLVQGFARLVEAIGADQIPTLERVTRVALGIACVVAALVIIAVQSRSSWHLVIPLVGSVMVGAGFVEGASAMLGKRPHRAVRAWLGAVALITGAALLAWPRPSVRVLLTIIGVSLVVQGVLQFIVVRRGEPALHRLNAR